LFPLRWEASNLHDVGEVKNCGGIAVHPQGDRMRSWYKSVNFEEKRHLAVGRRGAQRVRYCRELRWHSQNLPEAVD